MEKKPRWSSNQMEAYMDVSRRGERGPHRGSRHHCPPACLSVDAEHVHGSSSTAPKKTRTNDATHPTIHVMNHDSIPPGSEREVTISSGGAVGDRTETGAEPWRRPADAGHRRLGSTASGRRRVVLQTMCRPARRFR